MSNASAPLTNVAQSPADRLDAGWTGKPLRYRQEEAVAMSRTSRALYTPLSVATSVAGGMIAGSVFNQIWKRVADTDQPPPDPKDLNRSTRAALLGAALQAWCSVWCAPPSTAPARGATKRSSMSHWCDSPGAAPRGDAHLPADHDCR